jgi:hypothetical protein
LKFTTAGSIAFAVSAVLLARVWQGCSVYDESLLLPGDGGADADAHATSCLALPPLPPAHDDPSTDPPYTGFLAMQTIDVGASPDGGPVLPDSGAPLPPIGFDLDQECTCCGQPAGAACTVAGSCVAPNIVCDDNQGRDHVALNIFRVIPNATATAVAGMQAGQFSILLQIGGYNGTPNDSSVTLALYVSNGIEGVVDGGLGPATLRHDGTDLWTVDSHYLSQAQNGGTVPDGTNCNGTDLCVPSYIDNDAYVTDGILVSRPSPVLQLTFGYHANIGGALMKLSDAIISGKLVPTIVGGQKLWGLVDGSISGRWASSQLLGNLATLPDAVVDGSFFCGTDPLLKVPYAELKAYVCAQQDIMANSGEDNTGAPCDALSMSLGFTAEPAQVGTVYTVSPPPSGCLGEGGALWTDRCQ